MAVYDTVKSVFRQAIENFNKRGKREGESDMDFTIRRFGQERGRKKVEHIIVIDYEGTMLYNNVGDQGKVALRYDTKDLITVHNHPKPRKKHSKKSKPMGASFSSDDVVGAVGNDEAEAIVFTGYGTKYSMKRPDTGWNKNLKDREYIEEVFNKFKSEIADGVIETARQLVEKERTKENKEKLNILLDNHTSDFSRNAMKYLSKEYDFEYIEEKVY